MNGRSFGVTAEPKENPEAAAGWPSGKVGYAVLLGRPNTGKSTFLNTALEYHLAPVSPKPQTTRRRLLGVFSARDAQILFLDTPGVHEAPDALHQAMMEAVRRALADADVILCLADSTRKPGTEDELAASAAAQAGKPVLLLVNKADIAEPAMLAETQAWWKERLPAAEQRVITATSRTDVLNVLELAKTHLPQGPFLYDPEILTTDYERDIGAELIREAVLETLREEVPHATAVEVEEWKETDERVRVKAVLHVERDSQKGILIGRGGQMLKLLRKAAVARLEPMCGRPVSIELFVKVTDHWRRDKAAIRRFGYR